MELAPLNITVVEDDHALRGMIVKILQKEGHQVSGLESAESIDDEGGAERIDLLLTDLKLPGESGLSLASRFHAVQPEAGVIMITALDQPQDRATGYAHGADIYLTKPIHPEELIAAVNAFARRYQHSKTAADINNRCILNQDQRTIQGEEETVSISRNEMLILLGLARAPNHLLELWQLFEILSIEAGENAKSALEVRIVRLRKKIVQAGYRLPSIQNIRGRGYQLTLPIQLI